VQEKVPQEIDGVLRLRLYERHQAIRHGGRHVLLAVLDARHPCPAATMLCARGREINISDF